MMNNKQQANKTTTGTSIQKVKQQNANYGAEFSTETSVQHVKEANKKAEAKKSQASGKYGQNAQQ
ncbi:gamma-type small acid-soluble spore protein [Ectobacillus antri]|jgi:small acid-soluble spore protein E (minor gamma-type SASP)|uniref:Small, acid-soluble spore protein gamma-type n=1 Tax=Ectobacillus antri TaxID=2486280 RepID=A0ABT6H7T9_9BACI|nr:gamma-type small acid-soluble spore protein [Ectobacillus antri]MDG4657217.1 gamma-type small acid-soluble spore protein [Ectobacillus antri]MDG5754431.1 gamma-type small acid-soluble spore protein [Ectobacillus antri]